MHYKTSPPWDFWLVMLTAKDQKCNRKIQLPEDLLDVEI